MSLNFTAIDFETANSSRASVCQIGLARVVDGRITKKVSEFVTPPAGFGEFSQRNIEVHGIRASDVSGAPQWEEILGKMLVFAEGTPFVGHNVSFEKSVVKAACAAAGVTQPQLMWGCSLKMARKHLPGYDSYSLGRLSADLGLSSFNHHDAGDDALASAELVLHAADTTNITDFHRLFAL